MTRTLMITVMALFYATVMYAQPGGQAPMMKDGKITGIIMDKDLNHPVEYANIALYSLRDSSLVTGTVTTPEGKFTLNNLRPGRYYISVKFIGYETQQIKQVMVTPKNKLVDLGEIELHQAAQALEGVNVVAERSPIVYKIDKKVINPEQFATAASGTSLDVLEQTPSVTVDIEGNVSLRGSSSFTVLIDGRPSPFSGADALEQIPASSIENIEIITNPSAKYDPEGTAGIINIISKKSKLDGLSGLINAKAGTYDNYGADALVNYRTGKWNLFVGTESSHNNREGNRFLENATTVDNTTSYLKNSGDFSRSGGTTNYKAGFDYKFSDNTTFSANVNFGSRERNRYGELDYHEWTSPATTDNFYTGISDNDSDGDFLSLTSVFTHKFDGDDHRLDIEAYYRDSEEDDIDRTKQLDASNAIYFGQENSELEDEESLRLKVDYIVPVGEKSKLEAGLQSRIEDFKGSNTTNSYNTDTKSWAINPLYSYESSSEKNIHAAYATLSNEFNKVGLQVGLRTEYTDRTINVDNGSDPFELNRWDFFPTLHFSVQLPGEKQFMASYTRRINRPRDFYLEPYETYMDAYNIRSGNPDLAPEYIDSYELGLTKRFGTSFMSLEAFYRKTNDKIERTRTPYSGNIMYNTFENVGNDHSIGTELMINMRPAKWYTLNLSGSVFHYKVTGELYGADYSQESFNWNTRIGNSFMLSPTTKFQLDGMFTSASKTAQGEREGFMAVNAAVKKDFLNNRLTATLQARDIFDMMKFEFTTIGPDYSSHMKFNMKSPSFSLNLSYRINNYKIKKSKSRGESMGGGEGDFF
ncbi:TonB-dependent receptor [Puteibacter caeruleilacunae]|nr:TonB-dependent receptor [Puteibacter caeruleilacunae]